MIYAEVKIGDKVIGYAPVSGLVLDPYPRYNKRNWGREARTGYKYKTCINIRHCPACGSQIWANQFVHELDKKTDKWKNFCNLCRKDLTPALL